MKLRTAIRKAHQVYIIASCGGNSIGFQVSKAEVIRVLSDGWNYLDQDIEDEDEDWSMDDGMMPQWHGNDLTLRFA